MCGEVIRRDRGEVRGWKKEIRGHLDRCCYLYLFCSTLANDRKIGDGANNRADSVDGGLSAALVGGRGLGDRAVCRQKLARTWRFRVGPLSRRSTGASGPL